MPTIDLPLEALQTYAGRSQRPADFDAYWSRALGEMRATDPKIEVRPAEFQAEYASCDHLFFTGVGGARVHAKLIQPTAVRKASPAVVFFHGYTMRSGDWTEYLAWAARGYTVAAMDVRGQGGLSEDRGGVAGNTQGGHIIRGLYDSPEKLFYRSVFCDAAQLAGIVMGLPGVDPAKLGAMGASQGGALALVCAALEPRVSKCVTIYPFLSDYRRVWEMDQGKGAYDELRTFFRRFDPTHARADEWFGRLAYIDVQHLADRVNAQVLMATGLMDAMCPPSTQFAAYNKLRCEKRVEIFPDFDHENLPGFSETAYRFLSW